MIIDSSAILAILLREPEAEIFAAAIAGAETRLISAANYLEAGIRLDALPLPRGTEFDDFLDESAIEIVPVTVRQARLAREAFRRFGRGQHAAKLNFGDCFAYALARDRGEALLFKGEDFTQTDVTPALR